MFAFGEDAASFETIHKGNLNKEKSSKSKFKMLELYVELRPFASDVTDESRDEIR